MRAQGIILLVYDQGNFPGHRVLQKNKKNMHGALRMGAYGLAWVRSDAFIRREAKTREKEEQMDAQDAFFNVRQRPKTSTKSASVVADDQRGSCGGIGQSRGKQTGIYSRRNAQAKKQTIPPKKKENEQ